MIMKHLVASQAALEQALDAANNQGPLPLCMQRLRVVVLGRFLREFHRAIVGDPPPRVESMTIRRKSGPEVVRARPCLYSLSNETGEYINYV